MISVIPRDTSDYPFSGPIHTLKEFYDIVEDADKLNMQSITHISYYNPYNLESNMLSKGVFYLHQNNTKKAKRSAFFSSHIYEIVDNQLKLLTDDTRVTQEFKTFEPENLLTVEEAINSLSYRDDTSFERSAVITNKSHHGIKCLDLSPYFEHENIIANYLFQWLSNPVQTVKQIQSSIDWKNVDLPSFIADLNKLFLTYKGLIQQIKEINELDTSNKWYDEMLKFLELPELSIELPIFYQYIEGDEPFLIDIAKHRGTGMFLVWKADKWYVIPTLGDFGNVLPEPGFDLVKRYGIDYFKNSEICSFQISNMRRIEIKGELGEYETAEFKAPIYLEVEWDIELDCEEMYEIRVDDVYLYGYLSEQFM